MVQSAGKSTLSPHRLKAPSTLLVAAVTPTACVLLYRDTQPISEQRHTMSHQTILHHGALNLGVFAVVELIRQANSSGLRGNDLRHNRRSTGWGRAGERGGRIYITGTTAGGLTISPKMCSFPGTSRKSVKYCCREDGEAPIFQKTVRAALPSQKT